MLESSKSPLHFKGSQALLGLLENKRHFYMKKKLILFIPVCLFLWTGLCGASEVVVIVNKDQNISSLSLIELQYIYRGDKKKWESGERIVLFLPPENSEAMKFLIEKVLVKRNKEDLAKYYLKMIFQQKIIVPPEPTSSTNETVWRVSSDFGGIAIVDKKDLPENKLVTIIEVSP
jgi:hypothetical protein